MTNYIPKIREQIRINNFREATYLLFSMARSETDDYNIFDEEAEIKFYYSIRRAAKSHPERLNLLIYYLNNIRGFYHYLPNLTVFFETGNTNAMTIGQTPYDMLYNSARAS